MITPEQAIEAVEMWMPDEKADSIPTVASRKVAEFIRSREARIADLDRRNRILFREILNIEAKS